MRTTPSIRFVCPRCREKFPFFLWAPVRIRNGLFSAAWLKCPHCGLVSRQTANWPHALWAWPLAAFAVMSIIDVFRNTNAIVDLHRCHPGVYGALVGLSAGLCSIIIRLGVKLMPLLGESAVPSASSSSAWRKTLIVVLVVVGVALVTHHWIATFASFVVCVAVNGALYLSADKRGRSAPVEKTENNQDQGLMGPKTL